LKKEKIRSKRRGWGTDCKCKDKARIRKGGKRVILAWLQESSAARPKLCGICWISCVKQGEKDKAKGERVPPTKASCVVRASGILRKWEKRPFGKGNHAPGLEKKKGDGKEAHTSDWAPLRETKVGRGKVGSIAVSL